MTLALVLTGAVLAFFMAGAGLSKVTAQPAMVESAQHFSIPWERYRLIGVVECAAAVGLVVGLWWGPLGLAAATGLVVLTVGALAVHARARDPLGAMVPAIVALALAVAHAALQVATGA